MIDILILTLIAISQEDCSGYCFVLVDMCEPQSVSLYNSAINTSFGFVRDSYCDKSFYVNGSPSSIAEFLSLDLHYASSGFFIEYLPYCENDCVLDFPRNFSVSPYGTANNRLRATEAKK